MRSPGNSAAPFLLDGYGDEHIGRDDGFAAKNLHPIGFAQAGKGVEIKAEIFSDDLHGHGKIPDPEPAAGIFGPVKGFVGKIDPAVLLEDPMDFLEMTLHQRQKQIVPQFFHIGVEVFFKSLQFLGAEF